MAWFRLYQQATMRPPEAMSGRPATPKSGLDTPTAPRSTARGSQMPRGNASLGSLWVLTSANPTARAAFPRSPLTQRGRALTVERVWLPQKCLEGPGRAQRPRLAIPSSSIGLEPRPKQPFGIWRPTPGLGHAETQLAPPATPRRVGRARGRPSHSGQRANWGTCPSLLRSRCGLTCLGAPRPGSLPSVRLNRSRGPRRLG